MELAAAQQQITKAGGNALTEKKKNARGDFQDLVNAYPYEMIDSAKSLQCVAKELDRNGSESPQPGSLLFMGKQRAVPILLSLATEIALKAWQIQEGKKMPDREHDLLKLFESLESDTRKMLEERMRMLSPTALLDQTKHPLRHVLRSHKEAFKDWRYSYEIILRGGAMFETGDMDRALTAIVDVYYELISREFRKVTLKPR